MKNGGLGSVGKASGNMGRNPAPYNDYEMQDNLRVQESRVPDQASQGKFVPGPDVQCGSHLTTAADSLTGFPVFPQGTKSSVCRLLDRDTFNNLCQV